MVFTHKKIKSSRKKYLDWDARKIHNKLQNNTAFGVWLFSTEFKIEMSEAKQSEKKDDAAKLFGVGRWVA